jgi:hypothetical protein
VVKKKKEFVFADRSSSDAPHVDDWFAYKRTPFVFRLHLEQSNTSASTVE